MIAGGGFRPERTGKQSGGEELTLPPSRALRAGEAGWKTRQSKILRMKDGRGLVGVGAGDGSPALSGAGKGGKGRAKGES